jgi:hypothetical protein
VRSWAAARRWPSVAQDRIATTTSNLRFCMIGSSARGLELAAV